jgi:Rieske Fe-S protein
MALDRDTCGECSRRGLLLGVGLAGLTTVVGLGEGTAAADQNGSGDEERAKTIDLGRASRIKIGGGVVISKHNVVVTRPTKRTYRAFSAICTHQGCTVGSVAKKRIVCPCHGSKYSIWTGAALVGPATDSLGRRNIKIVKGRIKMAR